MFSRPFAAFSLVLLALLAASGKVFAQPVEFTSVEVGFNGAYKVGAWTPVRVHLKLGEIPADLDGLSGRVSLGVQDGDSTTSRVFTPRSIPLTRPAPTAEALLYVKFGGIDNELLATFHPEGGRRISRRFEPSSGGGSEQIPEALFTSHELLVNLGPNAGFEAAAQLNRAAPSEALAIARLTEAGQLPTRWYGYDGVDYLVLTTSRPEIYRTLVDNVRLEALDRWLRMGGTLILFAGAEAAQVLDPNEPLARFAPGRYREMATLTTADQVEAYADAIDDPIPLSGQLRAPVLEQIRGHVEVRQGNVPLVVRAPYGFGQVVLVGLDFDRGALVRWNSRGRFLNRILGKPAAGIEKTESGDEAGRLAHSGLTDLSGQLRAGLDQFSGVKLIPFGLVAALTLAYIALIGPIDYFFVKKVLKRMEATWITFPLIVALVSWGAYELAWWMKGDQLGVNKLDLVDVDIDAGLARGTSWFHVFSPRVEDYDVAVTARLPEGRRPEESHLVVSWMGLPGSALGGMNQSTSPGGAFAQSYHWTPELDRMVDVPIQVWSTKAFTARWLAPSEASLKVDLIASVDEVPEGTITNTLDVPLNDCLLAFGRWAFDLGDLQPGQSATIDFQLPRRELADELTGRRLQYDEESKQLRAFTSEYDEYSRDVPAVVRQMMFYERSGGRQYVGLLNRHQRFVDLSRHLELGRGVLVASVETPGAGSVGAELKLNGEPPPARPGDKRWTVYRFVFDVQERQP